MEPENQAQPEVEETPPPAGPTPTNLPDPSQVPEKGWTVTILNMPGLHLSCLCSSAGNPRTAELAFQARPELELLKSFFLEDLKTFTRNGGD